MEIIMIRHFRTPGNLEKRYIGRTDESLADTEDLVSLAQKRRLSCGFVEELAASPMKRCIETAKLLFPYMNPVLSDKMKECDFGVFEGKNYEELKDMPDYRKWLERGGNHPIPEGESRAVFQSRCMEGFSEMIDIWIEKQVKKGVMVVHGGTIMSVLSKLDSESKEFYHWQPENGGGYRVFLNEKDWKKGSKTCREIQKL